MNDIIFISRSDGSDVYVNRAATAAIVCNRGIGRIEFELSANEIAELEAKEPGTLVWGDEADLVFPGVTPDWSTYVKRMPVVEHLPDTEYPWLYWCMVDKEGKIVEQW